MSNNLEVKIKDLIPAPELKDSAEYPISQEGVTYKVNHAQIEGKIVNKLGDRFIHLDQKGAANGVATLNAQGEVEQPVPGALTISDIGVSVAPLDVNKKIPNENLNFGEVKEGDSNVVSGDEVFVELSKKQDATETNTYFKGIIEFVGTNNIQIKKGSYVVKGIAVSLIVNHSDNLILENNTDFHTLLFDKTTNKVSLVRFNSLYRNKDIFPIAVINPAERSVYNASYNYQNDLILTGTGSIEVDFLTKKAKVSSGIWYKIGNGRGLREIPSIDLDFSSIPGNYCSIYLDIYNNAVMAGTTANSFGVLDLAILDLSAKQISSPHLCVKIKGAYDYKLENVKELKILGGGIEIDPITKIFRTVGTTYFQRELLYTPKNNNIDMKPMIGGLKQYVSVVVGNDNKFEVVLAKDSLRSGKLEVFTYNPITNDVYGVNRHLVTIKGDVPPIAKKEVKDKRIVNVDSYPKNYYMDCTDIGLTDMSNVLITSDALQIIEYKANELISYGFEKKEIGRSVEDRPLYLYTRFADFKNSFTQDNYAFNVILFCGVHGNEQGAAYTASFGLKKLFENENDDMALFLKRFCNIYYFPVANPDGIFNGVYNNANDVNLSGDFLNSQEPENIAIKNEFDLIENVDCFIDYHNIANGDALVYYSSEETFLPLALSHFNNLSLKWVSRGKDSKMYGYVKQLKVSNSPRDYMLSKTRLSTNLESPWRAPWGTVKYDKESLEFATENYINFLYTFLKGV